MSNTGDAPHKICPTGTATNCNEIGHCWHQGTAVGSLWCCRCGQYKLERTTIHPTQGHFSVKN